MRPKRLELQGFGSFRDRTVVDFEGSDLFVLTGPTGSGKSTIIDGITFALYGAIPRYEKDNLFAPVISNGKEEARVRLDFSLGDRELTAVRVIRRTATGATTREARLEEGSQVLAGTAREMQEAVPALLGLSFGHFQKCVVLPQGAFAQLLHDDHSSRLELLRSLLEMRVFVRMRERANARAQEANALATANEGRLANELADATEEALAEARAYAKRLHLLASELEGEASLLAAERDLAARLGREVEELEAVVDRLGAVAAPAGIGELATKAVEAGDLLAGAEKGLDEANQAVESAGAAVAELPGRGEMEALQVAHEQIAGTRARLEKAQEEIDRAVGGRDEAKKELAEAVSRLDEAERHREEVLKENYAFRAAEGLQAGDRCPVCGEVLRSAPELAEPPGHGAAQTMLAEAKANHEKAARSEREAEARVTSLGVELRRLEEELATLASRVDGKPEHSQVLANLAAIRTAEERLGVAQGALRAAQVQAREARAGVAAAQEAIAEAWEQYDRARDSVAAQDPPVANRRDLLASWEELAEWARASAQSRELRTAELRKEAEEAEARRRNLLTSQRERCEGASVPARSESPASDCSAALALAEDRVRTGEERIATATRLREEQKALTEREQVARELVRHLRGDKSGFESWYVRRVLEGLTDDASKTLRTLSREQFSLALNDNQDFEVIDHANADDRRLVRTLSGGETFLASLSLALALADSFALEAAGRAPRLDAIFLDEGFGTLDPETLDVVAAAIEELSAAGRMVGLVTHVGELAARMPVRFEVRRGPGGSTIERVEA